MPLSLDESQIIKNNGVPVLFPKDAAAMPAPMLSGVDATGAVQIVRVTPEGALEVNASVSVVSGETEITNDVGNPIPCEMVNAGGIAIVDFPDSAVAAKLDAANLKLDAIATNTANINVNVGDVNIDMDDLEALTGTGNASLASIDGKVATEAGLIALGVKLQAIADNTDELEIKADSINLNTDELEGKVDATNAKLDALLLKPSIAGSANAIFYEDGTSALTTVFALKAFGFPSFNITLTNDGAVGEGWIEYSFDGVTTHGRLKDGEGFSHDFQTQTGIYLRGQVGGEKYRLGAY